MGFTSAWCYCWGMASKASDGSSGRSTHWRSARPTACSRSAAATRRGLPGLRKADDGNDHRDRPLAQDDRDSHAEEPRARRRGQGRARGHRAGGRGPRRSAVRQGLRLQRRSLLAAAGGGARCCPRAPRLGWGRLPLLGRAPLRAGAEPGTSGTSWPTGYARADSPSTGCWSRTCARSPRSARWPAPGRPLRSGLRPDLRSAQLPGSPAEFRNVSSIATGLPAGPAQLWTSRR